MCVFFSRSIRIPYDFVFVSEWRRRSVQNVNKHKWKQTHFSVDYQRKTHQNEVAKKAKIKWKTANGRQIKQWVNKFMCAFFFFFFVRVDNLKEERSYECVCVSFQLNILLCFEIEPRQHDYSNRRKSCHTRVSIMMIRMTCTMHTHMHSKVNGWMAPNSAYEKSVSIIYCTIMRNVHCIFVCVGNGVSIVVHTINSD